MCLPPLATATQRYCSTRHDNMSASTEDATLAQDAAPAAELLRCRTRLCDAYMRLLADRRAQYRDKVLLGALRPIQAEMQALLRRTMASPHHGVTSDGAAPPVELFTAVTPESLRRLKVTWMQAGGMSAQPGAAHTQHAHVRELRELYATLVSSGLLRTEEDVRLLLRELHDVDLLEPDGSFYEALFLGLWSLEDARHTTSPTSDGAAAGAAQATSVVAGEPRQLRRGVVGDLASHYMGHALAQLSSASAAPPGNSDAPPHTPVRLETWEIFFTTLANAQPAPKLVDLWWGRFIEWLDERERNAAGAAALDDGLPGDMASDLRAAVPYKVAHAVLAWCAQSRELQRALDYFKAVNQRGVAMHAGAAAFHPELAKPGCLTVPSSDAETQQLQLALLVKLMASTKSVKFDGGLRALVVRDVQRQISPAVLYAAPWGVINDLIAGLSVPSAMQLLRRCSSTSASATPAQPQPAEDEDEGAGGGGKAAAATDTPLNVPESRTIPFYLWAALLRRCGREHLQDEAESLFLFLRKKFSITALEKRELVEIMMRMYATMHPADFPSTMDVFLQHVLRVPDGEPPVTADAVLYELLIKSADSRNAAMMVFLEACAAGAALTEEVFEALMGSTQYKTVASLSRKLPHDYAASSLDAQLKIPANADAHLRREEALRARGKPLYDSTGDAG
ncbi:hypothetical protein NESM_000137100 [Novymonas esmeraldas]|uniref:Uncharacterized protein n=1 Tax=Novymonas esmeraldas TaxID=1808958 RepID=A0AAW0F3G8_9TRYP